MGCFRYISINNLHKRYEDDDYDFDCENSQQRHFYGFWIRSVPEIV
jgi:hypothetical protein